MDDFRDLSLAQLGAALRAGQVSSVELADAALAADRLGAYRQVDEAQTRRQAAVADDAFAAGRDMGPLQGIPLSIKDLFGVPGYSTYAGSPAPLPARFERAGPVVSALLAQLCVITGKTHTVEFAFGGVGTNPHHPTPINPWDAEFHRAPGGSTSGGGVSLCEGSAWVAFGSDTAGSVRIPASWTGNVALKTTRSRWSTEGIVPLSPTLDTPGVLARTIADLRLAVDQLEPRAMPRVDASDLSSLRFGRCADLLFDGCSAGVVEAVDGAVAELTAAGAHVESLALPELHTTFELFKRGGPVSIELNRFLSTELPDWIRTLDPNVRARIGDAARLPDSEYAARLEAMSVAATAVDQRLRAVDVTLSPTVANTPPRLVDIDSPERYGPQNLLSLRNTAVVSYLGLCAVTLPVGTDAEGMPVGLQLIARAHQEPRLLAVAAAVEARLGTGRDRLGVPPRIAGGAS